MHARFQSADALSTRQHCLPFFLLTLISLTFSNNRCLQITKFKGVAVSRVKSLFHLYLMVPKFDSEHPQRGRGERSTDLAFKELPHELSPRNSTPETNLLDKADGVAGSFSAGHECFGRTAGIFPDIGEKKNHGCLHGRGGI